MKKKVVSVYPRMKNYGGAQKILVDVHNELAKNKEFISFVASFDRYEDVDNKYSIAPDSYIRLSNILLLTKLKHCIIISHHRKITSFLYLMSFFLKFKLIHVAHNTFETYKFFSFFPSTNLAVSKAVFENCINYFHIKKKYIKIIYNGVDDLFDSSQEPKPYNNKIIRILYPARVTSVKKQVELVKILKGRIRNEIQIDFAGDGNDFDALKNICFESKNFRTLGFVTDVVKLYKNYDYVMLFSAKEGLGICLIDGCMTAKPIITNGVGGTKETLIDGKSGFLCSNYEDLINVLNALPNISEHSYYELCNNSRKIYNNRFDKRVMIKKYIDVITNL